MQQKRTYLISGASGFIGSCLTRRLVASGEEVHIVLRKESNLWRIKEVLNKVVCHKCDLLEADKLKSIVRKIKPEIIYHLTAYGAYPYQSEADKIINTNILGTENLLAACSGVNYALFVNTGTSSEYGFKQKPMKETDLLEPVSLYALSKSAQTILCAYIARAKKRPVVTLRPFSVYGPYEQPCRLIPTLMRALYFKQKMKLVAPKISHDYIYIDDVIDAFLLIDKFKKYPGEIFNLGTARQSSLKEVVNTAVKVAERNTEFIWGKMKPRGWDTDYWVADISKAKRLLGWEPKINLDEGLRLTWRWFKEKGYEINP